MIIRRSLFLKELLFISSVCEKKATIPVLSYFLLEAVNSNTINLRGTNIDLTAETSIDGFELEKEAFCLPIFETINALKNMTGEDVELTNEDTRVWLKDKKSKFKLPKMDSENFPEVAENGDEVLFSLPANTLQKLLRLTTFACDTKDRYSSGFKQNIYLKIADKKLYAWALDGSICSYLTLDEVFNLDDITLSFPAYFKRPCELLCEIGERIKFKSNWQNIEAIAGPRSVSTRLINTQSPQVDLFRVTPGTPSFLVNQTELRRAVQSIHSFEDLYARLSSVKFIIEDSKLKSYARSSKFDAEMFLDAKDLTEFEEFALDGFHLSRFLGALGAENLEAYIGNRDSRQATKVMFLYKDSDLTMEFYQQGLTL